MANGAEVLILGALGCGAFVNPPEIVSKAFRDVQIKYEKYFDTTEYAVFCGGHETQNYDAFCNEFSTRRECMRLRNVLIAVYDMDKAINFYKEIFGLQVILNQDGNVIMSEGLVLQDAAIWKKFLGKDMIPKNNMTELYFEESDIEGFVKKLDDSDFEIEYVNKLMTHSWGQKVVRFYDPDGNLIEVGTPMN